MNNHEIIAMADRSHMETGFRTPRDKVLNGMLDLARSDERQKLAGQIPPEGSGPWAIMQHWAGKRVCHEISGEHYIANSHLEAKSGWSLVAGPKPMTFVDGDRALFKGAKGEAEFRGGQWFPC